MPGCDIICCAADARNESIAHRVINKYASEHATPVIWGGANNWGGVLTVIAPPTTPCLDCIFSFSEEGKQLIKEGKAEKPADIATPTDGPLPIIGAAAGITGSLQALETVRNILGVGKRLINLMIQFQFCPDVAFTMYDISKMRREGCPYCSTA